MEFIKRKELIICPNNIISLRQGYSLCTVFQKRGDDYTCRIKELLNVGYCESLDKFYYNRNVRLPKGVCQNFTGMICTKASLEEMEKLRIYDIDDVIKVIEENKKEIIKSREKVLHF